MKAQHKKYEQLRARIALQIYLLRLVFIIWTVLTVMSKSVEQLPGVPAGVQLGINFVVQVISGGATILFANHTFADCVAAWDALSLSSTAAAWLSTYARVVLVHACAVLVALNVLCVLQHNAA